MQEFFYDKFVLQNEIKIILSTNNVIKISI